MDGMMRRKRKCAYVEIGKKYKFAGYDWTVCELDEERHTAVIQSHGVTHGEWPGFKMAKFDEEINTNFSADIDGEDISAYDDKMQSLYDAIKEVEKYIYFLWQRTVPYFQRKSRLYRKRQHWLRQLLEGITRSCQ